MNSPDSSPEKSSKSPTYSGFFDVLIVQKGTETRLNKSVYFNRERGHFYAVSDNDIEAKFRGPEVGLVLVGYVENGHIIFPNREYQAMETIVPIHSGISSITQNTTTALQIALGAQESMYQGSSTSPSYLPPLGQRPKFAGKT